MDSKELALKSRLAVVALDVSPDGKQLAAGQQGDSQGAPNLTLWDLQSMECVAEVAHIPDESIASISFSHKGDTLAYVQDKRTVAFFDMTIMQHKKEHLEANRVSFIKYAPGKDLLLVCGQETSVWDSLHMKKVWEYKDYTATGITEGVQPDLLEYYYKLPERIAKGAYSNRRALAVFEKDSQHVIVTGKNDAMFSIYDIDTGQLKREYPGGVIQAFFMEMDTSGKYLFLIANIPDADIFWERDTMKRHLPQYFNEDFYGSSCFNFHPSSRFFATGAKNGIVSLRNTTDGAFLMQETLHTGNVNAVKFTIDGRYLISGGDDGKILVMDVSKFIN